MEVWHQEARLIVVARKSLVAPRKRVGKEKSCQHCGPSRTRPEDPGQKPGLKSSKSPYQTAGPFRISELGSWKTRARQT